MILERLAGKFSFGGRLLLAAIGIAVIAAPVSVGLAYTGQSRAQSQTEATPVIAPVFEVASIKPDKYASRMFRFGWYSHGTFSATGASLHDLVRFAYRVEDNQISGAPKWFTSKRYDIEAKDGSSVADELRNFSLEQRLPVRRRMMQALLEDRFKLMLHRETKELPIFALVVAKNGPKFESARPGDTYPNGFKGPDGQGRPGVMVKRNGQLIFQGLPIVDLVKDFLSQQPELNDRVVIDETGLKGDYDFKLNWMPESLMPNRQDAAAVSPSDSLGPSIFTALQEQLGLKLESRKGPVEILVIDHVEEPSEN